MKRYPKPIPPPPGVWQERATRRKLLLGVSIRGVAIRFAIVAAELVGYSLFHSSSLLVDALASLIDVASTLFLIVCIQLAARPPDDEHPFGHGRYEPIAGLQLSILLLGLGFAMVLQQAFQLWEGGVAGEQIDPRAWVIPLAAVVLLEGCYRVSMRAANKASSSAVAADARHYRIDAFTSAFAAVALGFGALYPEWSIVYDHVGAILIAFLMVGMGISSARENLHQLMDRTPEPAYFSRVRAAALRVKGVKETEKIRIQRYGPDAHVDIDVEVDPDQPVWKAHQISQLVRAEIQQEWASVRDVTVHIEPYYPEDH